MKRSIPTRGLSLLLAVVMALSLMIVPAGAQTPQGKSAALTLSSSLLCLDQSKETFTATLQVPLSAEQESWSQADWQSWADSIRWKLSRGTVDVQDPELYPNIYTGDYLENWMSWGTINQHGADGEPYFTLETPQVTVSGGTATVTLVFSHGIFFNMNDSKLPEVTNSLQAIGSNTFRYARNVWPCFIGNYELTAEVSGKTLAAADLEINVYESNLRYDELYDELMEIKALAEAKGRYFDVQSCGKSTDGREQWYAVVSDSAQSVQDFQAMNQQAMTDPETVLAEIQAGKDYRIPVMLNNVHPDEAGGVDAHLNLLRTLATEDTVTWNTITGLTDGKTVDMDMYDPKIVDFSITSDDGSTDYDFTGYGLKVSATTINGNGNDGRTDASEYYTFSEDKVLDVDEILDNLIVIVCPDENPDGRTYNTRPNGNGFDLNRDASNQTQVETQNISKLISQWNPVAFAEFHGFTAQFLCEPCTPPHEPNLEYDLFVEQFLLGAEAYGNAALATMSVQHKDEFETKYQTYYTPLRDSYDPETGWDAWDDLSTNYTPSYAMLNCGSMGFTIETPSGGESSVRLLECGMYGLWQFLSDCKETCYEAQLEFFRRSVNNEDHRADMEEWYVDMSNQQLDSDTWRVPYAENGKYFPEYYVLPVDAEAQRDPADAYEMAQFLMDNGVKVSTLTKDVTVNGTTYPAGSLVVDMYQAKRNYANCVLNLGYDASTSGFPRLYSESVASFPSMRGFDCVAITKVGAFGGALQEVTEITGSTQVTGSGSVVILANNGDETVRAVNDLLAQGKTVGMVTEGANKGDFVVSYDTFSSVADQYVLVAARVSEVPAAQAISQPTLFLPGRNADFGDDKVSSGYYTQWFEDGYGFINYDNIHNNGTSNYDVMAYVEQMGFQVTEDPAEADVIIGSVALNSGACGDAAVAAVKAGTPYIATGPNALKYVAGNLIPELTYESLGMEALHKVTYPADSLITASQTADGDDVIYSYGCNVLTGYPEDAQVLIQAAQKDSFLVGCMIDGDISGNVEAIAYEADGMDLTVFANSLVNRAHQQDDYLFATNAIYSKVLSGKAMTPADLGQAADPADTGVADTLETENHVAYLNGNANGTFCPEGNMTRAQAAQMFYNLLLDQEVEITVTFQDVPEDAWYAQAVNTLASLGILNGVKDGQFAPNRSITRAEFAAIAMRLANPVPEGSNPFSDVQEGDWFYDQVVGARSYGWINGYKDGTFRPNSTITRAEAATLVNRMLARTADTAYVDANGDSLRQFPDVKRSDWFYYAVMEAANAHDYTKTDSGEVWGA